jgi:hypothetical protein
MQFNELIKNNQLIEATQYAKTNFARYVSSDKTSEIEKE